MNPPNFTALQESFHPRIRALADVPAKIVPTEGATKVISEWSDGLPAGCERMNVHAWRSGLLLAWLKREETITAKTAEDAVKLAQYQVDSHDYYRVKAAENVSAKVQEQILRVLRKGPTSKRHLQQFSHASRVGTEVWGYAFAGLVKNGNIAQHKDSEEYFLVHELDEV